MADAIDALLCSYVKLQPALFGSAEVKEVKQCDKKKVKSRKKIRDPTSVAKILKSFWAMNNTKRSCLIPII